MIKTICFLSFYDNDIQATGTCVNDRFYYITYIVCKRWFYDYVQRLLRFGPF